MLRAGGKATKAKDSGRLTTDEQTNETGMSFRINSYVARVMPLVPICRIWELGT